MMDYNLHNGGRNERGDRVLLAALLIASEIVKHPDITDEEKRKIAREILCPFCRDHVPLENGHHIILGAEIPCDAEATS
jgi:hypothetical protein